MADKVIVIKTCPFCHKERSVTFPADAYEKYEKGGKVQDCFPNHSADDREFLISGICPTCWDRMFGSDDG